MASVKEWLAHPIAQATGLVTAIGAALHINALAGAVWAQSGTLFGMMSLLGLQLGPRVDAIPDEVFAGLAIAFGLVVAAKRGAALYDGFKKRL